MDGVVSSALGVIEDKLGAALDHHRQGRLGEAETIYRAILEERPDQADALHWLGLVAYQTGHNETAISLISRSLVHDPNSSPAYSDLGNAYLTAVRHLDAEEAFLKAIELDDQQPIFWCNLGSALKAMNKFEEARDAYTTALALKPEFPDALANLGGVLLELKQPKESERACRNALQLDPNSACANANLAAALIDLGRPEDAISVARTAIELDPAFSTAHQNYGEALRECGRFDEAEPALRRAIEFNSQNGAAHVGLGNVLFALDRMDEAKEFFRHAIKIDPGNADAFLALAHAELFNGNLSGFWDVYAIRWHSKNYKSFRRLFPPVKWQGEDLSGKSILVWGEQGIGDEILFAGLIPEIVETASRCVLECEPRLRPLFARSFPNVTVIARDDPPHPITAEEKFDLQAPSGDLARWLRPDFEGFKPLGRYLQACELTTNEIRAAYNKIGKGLKVGISWHSGVAKRVPLDNWGPILSIPGVQYISLQYGEHREIIEAANAKFGVRIIDDASVDPLTDMDRFSAQVAAMDAVITIDNSTLAVAAGLDIPTFALIPQMADWRYVSMEDGNCWHACLRQFSQAVTGEWGEAIQELSEQFQNEMERGFGR